jgi:TBC domain-containing protein kinase-like protein
LRGFLCPDNTNTLNLYLATFSSLLAYHDPELATHLDNISFTPEQFAVPWFMTLFAHVLPMDQLYLCLDLLLQAPCSFPLFLATAIMISLRDILLARDSSGCMTYFANVLTIDTQGSHCSDAFIFWNVQFSAFQL